MEGRPETCAGHTLAVIIVITVIIANTIIVIVITTIMIIVLLIAIVNCHYRPHCHYCNHRDHQPHLIFVNLGAPPYYSGSL